MNSRKKLTNLIANGQLEKVFTLIFNSYFIQFSKKDQKSLTNLSSRFHRIKRERQNNLIEDEVYRIEISRINDALLDVITKPSTKNTTNLSLGSKWLWLIVGLLVIGISGYGVYTKFEPISPNPNRMGQGQGIEMLVDNENDSLVQPPNKSTDEEKSAPSKSPKKPIQEPQKKIPPPVLSSTEIEKRPSPKTTIPNTTKNKTEETKVKSPPIQPVQEESKTVVKVNPIKEEAPLTIEIKSNKGNGKVAVKSSEILRLSIKTNKASYVRIIYVLADGVSVLLADDMRISEAQVNHFIEIGDGFIPDAPYGKEILYVYASNVKFNPIKNNIQNGYQIITEGLPEALKKSKGLRANIKVAEAKLEVVTSE